MASLNRSSNIILYADDIALYLPIEEQSDYSQFNTSGISLQTFKSKLQLICVPLSLVLLLQYIVVVARPIFTIISSTFYLKLFSVYLVTIKKKREQRL